MEFIVGALVVLGFLAIIARFFARDASGRVQLPRVVDESIGMWALRRLTGRRLGMRDDPELDDDLVVGGNAAAPIRAAPSAAVAAEPLLPDVLRRDIRVEPAIDHVRDAPRRDRALRRPARSRAAIPAHMVSPTPVLDLRRRQQAQRHRPRLPSIRRLGAIASIAAVLIVAGAVGAAIGAADRAPTKQGDGLAATGHPQLAAPIPTPTSRPSPKATAKPTATLTP